MSAISKLENYIIVTDYANRPFLLPPELEPAFNEWNENEFGEFDLDPDRFAEYLIAGEEEGEGLPPLNAALVFHSSGCLIPKAKDEEFSRLVTEDRVKNKALAKAMLEDFLVGEALN